MRWQRLQLRDEQLLATTHVAHPAGIDDVLQPGPCNRRDDVGRDNDRRFTIHGRASRLLLSGARQINDLAGPASQHFQDGPGVRATGLRLRPSGCTSKRVPKAEVLGQRL